MKIKIKYNGRRFPRIVALRNRGQTSFQEDRLTLELDEYDALYVLQGNRRLTPERWEFTVDAVVEAVEQEEAVDSPEPKEVIEVPKSKVEVKEEPKVKKFKKVKRIGGK